jgi:predicted transposase YdaD
MRTIDFFQTHLPPAIQEAIDLDSLTLQPNSYVDQSLKTVLSDILYKAKLKVGETAYLQQFSVSLNFLYYL